jgi:hypothetical protein
MSPATGIARRDRGRWRIAYVVVWVALAAGLVVAATVWASIWVGVVAGLLALLPAAGLRGVTKWRYVAAGLWLAIALVTLAAQVEDAMRTTFHLLFDVSRASDLSTGLVVLFLVAPVGIALSCLFAPRVGLLVAAVAGIAIAIGDLVLIVVAGFSGTSDLQIGLLLVLLVLLLPANVALSGWWWLDLLGGGYNLGDIVTDITKFRGALGEGSGSSTDQGS